MSIKNEHKKATAGVHFEQAAIGMRTMQTATEGQQKSIFSEFKLAKYHITIKALEHMILPEFKGSMLRGGFGHVFKRICCATREKTCDACLIRHSCPYAYVFETSPPEGAEYMHKQTKVPRPYVFELPLEDKTEYNAGEELTFHLVLIGRAIDLLPYFIFAIRELGEVGITARRHKFELTSIYAVDCLTGEEQLVYSLDNNMVHTANAVLIGSEVANWVTTFSLDRLTLNFLTPTRVKYRGNYCFNEIPFIALVQNITIRLNALSYFHCDGVWDENIRDMREMASSIKATRSTLTKRNILRYSNRQGKKDSLSGVTGAITYEGDLGPFLPILILGQFVHVGSDAVFGCGQYEMEGISLSLPR